MTAQTKSVIKSYFETGDRPTQSQFADLIDSYQDTTSSLTTLSSAAIGAYGLQVLAATSAGNAPNPLPTTVNSLIVYTSAGYEPATIGVVSSARTLASQIVMGDSVIDVETRYGLSQAGIQNALNNAPLWSTLYFPATTINTTSPLTMNRPVHLSLGGCRIVGNFSAASTQDVLRIAITSAGGAADVRSLIIDGGSIYHSGGGNCAINVNPTTGVLPLFEMSIQNGNHAGYTRCIRIGGANASGDTNFCSIINNNLGTTSSAAFAVVELDSCADGHRISDNLIYGTGVGVRVNVVAGAYNTEISSNGIVTRDGSVQISNGARVMVLNNQCEQQGGSNRLVPSSMVLIQGLSYISHGNIIEGNNFGAGTDVNYNIVLYNARGNVIDKNQFNTANTADVLLGSDSGLTAQSNTIGSNNWYRGTRTIRSAPTDFTRYMNLSVAASASTNRGYWRSDATLSNSWTSTNFEFMVDSNSILHMEGALDGGTTTGGTLMATFPDSCYPLRFKTIPFTSETGTFGYVNVSVSGAMTVGTVPASPNNLITLGHVSFPVKWLNTYDPGA